MRLIDVEAFTKAISKGLCGLKAYEGRRMVEIVADCIVNAPTIEAKPVVYCKDCALRKTEDCAMYYQSDYNDEQYSCENDNDFCSWGRKTVKIPVISMEDVPRLAKEMEK